MWQQNLAKSKTAQLNLLNSNTLHKEWDLILIQEPYLDQLNNTRASSAWRVIYPTSHLTNKTRTRSVLLVNRQLSTDDWHQLTIPDTADITGIQMKGRFGKITILNIYNDCENDNSTDILRGYLALNQEETSEKEDDYMVWAGDFNRHHPLWDHESNGHLFTSAASKEAQVIITLLADYDMAMLLPRGINTLKARRTGNWTRPDNVFGSSNLEELTIRCEASPKNQGPCTDHVPILTVLDLPTKKTPQVPTRNFRAADWGEFARVLEEKVGDDDFPRAQPIATETAFQELAERLTRALQETIEATIPMTKPTKHTKRWWSNELEESRRRLNKLSEKAHRHRAIDDFSIEEELMEERRRYADEMQKAQRKHWEEFLDNATERELWIANKYATRPTTDGGQTRIPTLKYTGNDGERKEAKSNEEKCKVLAEALFPPPPTAATDAGSLTYPRPLPTSGPITKEQIRRSIAGLSPYKACGNDGIPNIVLKKSFEIIADHLLHLFRAVFTLETYYPPWRESITVILRKPGKPAYDTPKAYRPIALLNTLAKVLTSIVAEDLTHIMEKHGLLPSTQFGGRPGRTTSDSLQLLAHWVKHEWRQGRVVSILFLDIEGAFPNAVTAKLLHNMRKRRVPEDYVKFVERMLMGRRTKLRFDDYVSPWVNVLNGIGQGDPISMILYLFYNADLLEVARGRQEMALGFVDDAAMLTSGKDFEETNRKLRRMMTRRGGAYQWSEEHNSKFETSKFELMHLSRRRENDPTPGTKTRRVPRPILNLRNSRIEPAKSHKFLGVVVDDELRWNAHAKYAIAKATKYSLMFCRLTRPSTGLSPDFMRRLYIAVALPRMTYAAEVWYTPVSRESGGGRLRGSAGVTKKLGSIQRMAALKITGAMRTSPTDVVEIHAGLLPMELMMDKVCHRYAMRLASLPQTHPLHKPLKQAIRFNVARHRTPLHELARRYDLQPDDTETINPVRQLPTYTPPIKSWIAETKEESLIFDRENSAQLRVYTDGSGYKGNAGAAAVLMVDDEEPRVLRYHLGPLTRNTSFEAEAVALNLGIHLVAKAVLPKETTMQIDNQGVIQSLTIYKQRQSHYHFDAAHKALRAIARKERGRADFEIKIAWIAAHSGAEGNELVDKAAKEAAEGMSDPPDLLPPYLAKRRRGLPAGISALKQIHNAKLKRLWRKKWKASPRYARYAETFEDSCSFSAFRGATRGATRNQLSLLIQLHTGHAPLNRHLHRIGKTETGVCNSCKDGIESTEHYLLRCRAYEDERHKMTDSLEDEDEVCMKTLFGERDGIKALLQFVEDTKRLKKTFGDVSPRNLIEMDDKLENAGTGECDYDWPQEDNEGQTG